MEPPGGADFKVTNEVINQILAETAEPPPRRIPRSLNSIAIALDELDLELDEEEAEEMQPQLPTIHLPINNAAESAKSSLVSHPLTFTEQFPRIAIVTTAALPWMTGTAINPALRAVYLQRRGHIVHLLVPFVPPDVQPRLFPEGLIFHTHDQQRQHIIAAIKKRAPFTIDFTKLNIIFYPGRYDSLMGSIMATSDVQPLVPHPVECIVLEEPEHLTWYHTGKRWTRAFPTTPVVGVMHTNYVDYIRRSAGEATAALIARVNKFLCRQHTHKVIKLSDAVQQLARQETCFVHGVAHGFLDVGEKIAEAAERGAQGEILTKGAYFLGKGLWAKGFRELIDRLVEHRAWCSAQGMTPEGMDVFTKGEQLNQIRAEAERLQLPLTFKGGRDHLDTEMQAYRCFVNPSTSDVVATTSAEALAMGKWLVVPKHPCNHFFEPFTNCLVYETKEEFSEHLHHALTNLPNPLSHEERATLSWESATDRFLHCCSHVEIDKGSPLRRVAAKSGWVGYNVIVGAMETVRKALTGNGGGAGGEGAGAPAGPIVSINACTTGDAGGNGNGSGSGSSKAGGSQQKKKAPELAYATK